MRQKANPLGIFSFFGQRGKALSGTPAILEALHSRQFSPYPALGGTNLNAQRIGSAYVKVQNASYEWLYLYSPAVRQTVDYIARNFAQLGVKVYERVSDDQREHRGDHPAAQLLRSPNTFTPGNYFVLEFVKTYLVYGNAYALKLRPPGGGNLTLVLLNPSKVGIVGQSHFAVEAYRIYRPDGSAFDVPPEDMIHWANTTGGDPRMGESHLETLRELIAADFAAQTAVTELHKSGLALPGWLERPLDAPEISADGLKRLEESLANRIKKGKQQVPIFEEGMVFKQGGVTPEDAELLEGRRWTTELVARQFGMKNVPPEGEEERQHFYADVLTPLTDLCSSVFDLHILQREFGADDHYFEFSPEKMLNEQYKTLTSASGRPVLTTNEARARVNLPPIDGGDELVTPANVIVGDNPKPSPMVMPIQDPNKPPQDGSHRTDEEPSKALEVSYDSPGRNGHYKASLIPRRRRAAARRDRWAPEYQGVLDRHFDRQRRSLKSKKANTKAIVDDRWNTELGDGLNDVAERQFEAEGAQIAFRLASTFDPAYGENWLQSKSVGTAEGINRTTQQDADEADLDAAFERAKSRSPGAAMAYATSIAGFAVKVACEQAPGEPTVTIDGGECDICAPYQGSWPMSQLEAWPAYHPSCGCVADVEGGIVKASPVETKAQPVVIHNHVAPPNVGINVSEGALQFKAGDVTIDPPPPAQITLPDVNVHPAELNFAEGAFTSHTTVESAPPADIRFDKGAFHVENPVHVDAPAPDVRIVQEPINVTVEQPQVNVEAAQAPNVNVEMKGGKTKRTVTFSDGRSAEISDESSTKRTINFSDGRTAEINESDEDDQRPDED